MGGHPGEGVNNAFGACVACPHVVTAIVWRRGSKIPSVDGVGRPCFADRRFFMNEDPRTGRSERSTIVVEEAVYLCVGEKVRIDAGLA